MVSSFIIVSVLLFVFKISNVAIEGQEPRSIIFLPTAFLLIIFFLILLHVFVIIAILIFLPDPIWTWTWFFGVRLKVFTWRSKSKTAEQDQWPQQQEWQQKEQHHYITERILSYFCSCSPPVLHSNRSRLVHSALFSSSTPKLSSSPFSIFNQTTDIKLCNEI